MLHADRSHTAQAKPLGEALGSESLGAVLLAVLLVGEESVRRSEEGRLPVRAAAEKEAEDVFAYDARDGVAEHALDEADELAAAAHGTQDEGLPGRTRCLGVEVHRRELREQVAGLCARSLPVRRSSVPFATLRSHGSASSRRA